MQLSEIYSKENLSFSIFAEGEIWILPLGWKSCRMMVMTQGRFAKGLAVEEFSKAAEVFDCVANGRWSITRLLNGLANTL